MKNLDEIVNEIWKQECPLKKRELIHRMIDYSDGKRLTKIKYHIKVDQMPDWKLDGFAKNYKLSGDGLKVYSFSR